MNRIRAGILPNTCGKPYWSFIGGARRGGRLAHVRLSNSFNLISHASIKTRSIHDRNLFHLSLGKHAAQFARDAKKIYLNQAVNHKLFIVTGASMIANRIRRAWLRRKLDKLSKHHQRKIDKLNGLCEIVLSANDEIAMLKTDAQIIRADMASIIKDMGGAEA